MGAVIHATFCSTGDRERERLAGSMPHRRGFADPLDPKLECPLGRLAARGIITRDELLAAEAWRNIHLAYLSYIQAPEEFDDALAEEIEHKYKRGLAILMDCGRRVFHAVSALAVYEDPEELGDFEYTSRAAKIGFAALAKRF